MRNLTATTGYTYDQSIKSCHFYRLNFAYRILARMR